MKKFAIDYSDIDQKMALKCIVKGSKLMDSCEPYRYYTDNDGIPLNWLSEFAQDIHESEVVYYKDKLFYVNVFNSYVVRVYSPSSDLIYSPDVFYTDCPIFAKIWKKYNNKK